MAACTAVLEYAGRRWISCLPGRHEIHRRPRETERRREGLEQTGLLQELNLDAMSERMEELFPGISIDFSGFLEQLLAGNW